MTVNGSRTLLGWAVTVLGSIVILLLSMYLHSINNTLKDINSEFFKYREHQESRITEIEKDVEYLTKSTQQFHVKLDRILDAHFQSGSDSHKGE